MNGPSPGADTPTATSNSGTDFVRDLVRQHASDGPYGGRVQTRFPPEPNGYLHIGHAKSIALNFGLAHEFDGTCHLRFDDTNPETEDQVYVDAILDDVGWLGFEPAPVRFTSDYFGQLADWATELIERGLAYVDDQDAAAISATRGGFTTPGTDSRGRDRSVEENLDLWARMRAGEFAEGERVLRAKIDMAHDNMQMRDPVLYRSATPPTSAPATPGTCTPPTTGPTARATPSRAPRTPSARSSSTPIGRSTTGSSSRSTPSRTDPARSSSLASSSPTR